MSKKMFLVILAIGLLILAAAAFLVLREVLADGAQTPESAIWRYEKAAMTYDAADMVKYSSPYNRYELNSRSLDYSAKSLRKKLDKLYSAVEPMYTDENLAYNIVSIKYITQPDDIEELTAKYHEVYPTAEPQEFCTATMEITQNGKFLLKFTGTAVKLNGRWFYFK